ncbi:MAG: uroporphyrinogen decarboxylase family protein [Candidatus Omnitrophica bacterium]|nr:uroporphyrinogen decarboxylase family protein [Candidatus Omnitrophota bacterium]
MAYRGVLEDVQTAVSLGISKRVPVFAISEEFDVKAAGLTHREYTFSPDKMAACRIEAVRKFDYDWSCGWPDDYLEFEPLGVKLTSTSENSPLAPCEQPLPDREMLRRMKIPNFHKDARLPAFLQVLQKLKKEFGETLCITGRVAAPFTAVTLLYGIEKSILLMMDDPGLFMETAEFLAGLEAEWAKAQIDAGANAIWVGDCVAGAAFISPRDYLKFALPGAASLNGKIRKHDAFSFYHAGENSMDRLALMVDTMPDVLSVGGKIDLASAKKVIGGKVCIMGNMRGIEVLQRGDTETVRRETVKIMEAGKQGGGYIFNSEEGIPYETPEENMRMMIQTAKQHGNY